MPTPTAVCYDIKAETANVESFANNCLNQSLDNYPINLGQVPLSTQYTPLQENDNNHNNSSRDFRQLAFQFQKFGEEINRCPESTEPLFRYPFEYDGVQQPTSENPKSSEPSTDVPERFVPIIQLHAIEPRGTKRTFDNTDIGDDDFNNNSEQTSSGKVKHLRVF